MDAYHWKGKIVTKVVDEKSVALEKSGQKRKQILNAEEDREREVIPAQNVLQSIRENVHVSESVEKERDLISGRRIVELQHLGKQLWCVSCKEALSLQYIESETRRGLASKLLVRCHKCLLVKQITTGKQEPSEDKRSMNFDVNTKAASAVLHSGLGWTHLQKFCACMNIPCMDFETFKRFEYKVRLATENVGKKRCEETKPLKKLLVQFQPYATIRTQSQNEPVEPGSSSSNQDTQ